MLSDKLFGSGTIEMSIFNEGEFRGNDDIKAFYCRKCGFIELFRIANKRISKVTTERELWNYFPTCEPISTLKRLGKAAKCSNIL